MDPKAAWLKGFRKFKEKFDKIPQERLEEILRYCLKNYPTPQEQFEALQKLTLMEMILRTIDEGRIPKERVSEIMKYCVENYPTPPEQFKTFQALIMKEAVKYIFEKEGK